MEKKDIIAIIPARGGSKRLPRKNIKEFCGKPLVAWTIEAAVQSQEFAHVVVSTEDEEIAKISREYGAEVPFLRGSCSDDYSPSSHATLTALDCAENFYQRKFEHVAQLLPVCPLRNAEDVSAAVMAYRVDVARFLISAYRFNWMNPWWACELDPKRRPTRPMLSNVKRSQDLPEAYAPTGAIWIAQSEGLRQHQTFYGPGHVYWAMDWWNAVDIDNIEDFRLGEFLMINNARDRLRNRE